MRRKELARVGRLAGGLLWSSFRDLLPIVAVVAAFQLVVFRQPLDNIGGLLLGLGLVIVGLSLFILGLDMALFPLGEGMAHAFAKKGHIPWLVAFAFAIGFGTAFAEPALIAIADKAADLKTMEIAEASREAAKDRFALTLRTTVAVAVGLALIVGVFRIIRGWPIQYLIMGGYVLIIAITPLASPPMVAVAYDAGGVTTSTITVPLTAALGVGLASSIRGRNPLLDGFGMIALAALSPILFVLLLGILWP